MYALSAALRLLTYVSGKSLIPKIQLLHAIGLYILVEILAITQCCGLYLYLASYVATYIVTYMHNYTGTQS